MNTQEIIYLDHAAATPCDPKVVQAMVEYHTTKFYNPSSPYAPALDVRHEYEAAKQRIAVAIGGRGDDLVMTAGATESINLAMTAAKDGHVVTSSIEHKAVLESARSYDVTEVGVDNHGFVDLAQLESAITDRTTLVSIGMANNEIGTIQPMREIAEIVGRVRNKRLEAGNQTSLWLHSDGSQGAGTIDIHVARLGVDMITLNSGKMYGPKQVGLLWRRPGVKLQPIVLGGGQEMNLRSGTENVAGVIGFARAIELAEKHRANESKKLRDLRDMLQQRLEKEFSAMIVSGHPKKRLPGSLHVAFPGIDAERVLFLLEAEGVLVATGSACAASDNTESHVLRAINMEPSAIRGSLRLTLGKLSDEPSILIAAEKIIQAVRTESKRTGVVC